MAEKLLGTWVGPEATGKAWTALMVKHDGRVQIIRNLKLGIPMSIRLYNQVAHTTLSYVSEMTELNNGVTWKIKKALQKLTAAPVWAFPLEIMFGFNELRIAQNVHNIQVTARAAMYRLALRLPNLDQLANLPLNHYEDPEEFLHQALEQWRRRSITWTIFQLKRRLQAAPAFCSIPGGVMRNKKIREAAQKMFGPKPVQAGMARRIIYWIGTASEPHVNHVIVALKKAPLVLEEALLLGC